MPFFYAWETVDFPIQLSREDGTTGILTDCRDVIVSFAQSGVLIEKNKESADIALDVENDIINVHLGQAETGRFKPDRATKVQINILYEDSSRDASCEIAIEVLENLHKAVMD